MLYKKYITAILVITCISMNFAQEKHQKKGCLEVICGSVFSGKTTELLRRMERAEYKKKDVVSTTTHLNMQKNELCISTHNGQKYITQPILESDKEKCLETSIMQLVGDTTNVFGIDEIQFFPDQIIPIIQSLIDRGVTVIVAGLDLNCQGEPYSIMPKLMALADKLTKLSACCIKCGNDAYFSQRIINGIPAKYAAALSTTTDIENCHQPRCRNCFESYKIPEPTHDPITYTKKGSLEVICGCMFAGKSTELLRLIDRAEHNKKKVVAIKPQLESYYHNFFITTHNGEKRAAQLISTHERNLEATVLQLCKDADVVGLDDVHFYPQKMISIINKLINNGVTVIVAGLDLDFRAESFGIMPELMVRADRIKKLSAVCINCNHRKARFSQRIINNSPAKYDTPIIMTGAEECYQPRCSDCFATYKPIE